MRLFACIIRSDRFCGGACELWEAGTGACVSSVVCVLSVIKDASTLIRLGPIASQRAPPGDRASAIGLRSHSSTSRLTTSARVTVIPDQTYQCQDGATSAQHGAWTLNEYL